VFFKWFSDVFSGGFQVYSGVLQVVCSWFSGGIQVVSR
jgi:hypothetical protein